MRTQRNGLWYFIDGVPEEPMEKKKLIMCSQSFAYQGRIPRSALRTWSLFASGYTTDALNLRNLLDDGTDFIVKPIALSLLSERIGYFLGGRNAGGGGSVNKEGKAGKGTA